VSGRAVGAVVAVVVLAAACGGGSSSSSRFGGESPEAATDSTAPGNGGDLDADAPSSSAAVVLSGPAEIDAGLVPMFEWESFVGAANYRLAVVGPSGLPIWGWEGDGTSVYLGGLPVERPPGMRGPVIVSGSVWSVAALDGAGEVIALSEERSISPDADSTPAPSSAAPSTTAPAGPADIGEPCSMSDPGAVASVVGSDEPGEPSELEVGGELLGRSCSWYGTLFVPALRLGIFQGGASSFVDRCDLCEPRADIGEAAWGGVGQTDVGQPIGFLYVEAGGLTYTAETQGIQVSMDDLVGLIRTLIGS
jgi:hypothetical protein